MECNRDDALRARDVAERKFGVGEFLGARKFVVKAQELYPPLQGVTEMLAVLDARIAAQGPDQVKVGINQTDRYGILEAVVRAEAAFKSIGEAFGVLPDKAKKYLHYSKRGEECNTLRSVGVASGNVAGNRYTNGAADASGGIAGVGASVSAAAAHLSLVEEAYRWAQREEARRWAQRDKVDAEKELNRQEESKEKRLVQEEKEALRKVRENALRKIAVEKLMKKRKETIRKVVLKARRTKHLQKRPKDNDDLKRYNSAPRSDSGEIGGGSRMEKGKSLVCEDYDFAHQLAAAQATPLSPATSAQASSASRETFLTACRLCRMQYEYMRTCLGFQVHCQKCQKPFLANKINIHALKRN